MEASVPPFTIDQFYKFCDEGKLMAAKCKECKKMILPPRSLCPNCFSDRLEWVQLKGEGQIVTYTIIHIPPPEFQSLAPYTVAVVKLDEDVPFIGMMKVKNTEELKVGIRVRVSFEKTERKTWPFRPRILFNPVSENGS